MKRLNFDHPCFQNEPANAARMHLPVARRCNIKCAFCNPDQGDSCVHGCVPGLARTVMTSAQALAHVKNVREVQGIPIQIIGIAGPGEPLYNPETFETIELIRRAYPAMHICLSTNGLLLPELAGRVKELGVETLTVTVNCESAHAAQKIYEHVCGARDEAAMRAFLEKQKEGIARAVAHGLVVKVNSVLVPGVNDHELPSVARMAKSLGAVLHNVLPLEPRPDAVCQTPPTPEMVRRTRAACKEHLAQFERCRHCRADAVMDEKGNFHPCGE